MNFFEQQDQARHNTQRLVGLFVLSICIMVATIYGAALLIFKVAARNKGAIVLWQPNLLLLVAISTVVLIGCGSWYKLLQLRQGGAVIAKDLGGRLIVAEKADPAEHQLLNVVEEMAIAANISVPAVYVLDHETGINAFAAGFTPTDAVIGVTRGTLDQLDRDELQGVIGHEFSHILNGDMRLNLRLVGVLHGILLIYLMGRILFDWTHGYRSDKDKGNAIVFFGLALIVIGSIGLLCGRLIKSAVSRQREFLADASAVQFTRNPDGIAGALGKIAQHHDRALIRSPYAESNSHLFFGSALRFNFLSDLLATHPPLEQRIQRLRGRRGAIAPQPVNNCDAPSAGEENSLTMGLAASTPTRDSFISPAIASATPSEARAWLAQLPPVLQAGLQERQGAIAIVYTLLLDADNSLVQTQQLEWLGQAEPQFVEPVRQLREAIAQVHPRLRLPLLEQTLPVLLQSSAAACLQLFKSVQGLAKADGRWSLTEFVVYLILWHRLQPCLETAAKPVQYTTLDQVWHECLQVLSALAQIGNMTPDAVAYAFRSGLYQLPGISQQVLPETPPACNFGELRKSLERLESASPKLQQAIADACTHTVMVDRQVTVPEADLLRAILITLDRPLPPCLLPRHEL